MDKASLLAVIESKKRLKSNDYYFLNDTSKCIEYALELDLNTDDNFQIVELQKKLDKVTLPHHSQFVLSHNESVLAIINELESILVR